MSVWEELGFRGGPGLSDILGTSGQQEWADRFRQLVMSEESEMLDLVRVPAAVYCRDVHGKLFFHVVDQTRRTSITFRRLAPVVDEGQYVLQGSDELAPPLLSSLFDVCYRLPQGDYVVEWPVLGVELLGGEMSWSGP